MVGAGLSSGLSLGGSELSSIYSTMQAKEPTDAQYAIRKPTNDVVMRKGGVRCSNGISVPGVALRWLSG